MVVVVGWSYTKGRNAPNCAQRRNNSLSLVSLPPRYPPISQPKLAYPSQAL